jgi:hypothetical protein
MGLVGIISTAAEKEAEKATGKVDAKLMIHNQLRNPATVLQVSPRVSIRRKTVSSANLRATAESMHPLSDVHVYPDHESNRCKNQKNHTIFSYDEHGMCLSCLGRGHVRSASVTTPQGYTRTERGHEFFASSRLLEVLHASGLVNNHTDTRKRPDSEYPITGSCSSNAAGHRLSTTGTLLCDCSGKLTPFQNRNENCADEGLRPGAGFFNRAGSFRSHGTVRRAGLDI